MLRVIGSFCLISLPLIRLMPVKSDFKNQLSERGLLKPNSLCKREIMLR